MNKKNILIIIVLWLLLLAASFLRVEEYDVVVIGTEPEGITAAIAAAREGQRTLLISEHDKIGGLFTISKLNSLDLNYSPEGGILTKGLFLEFFEEIDKRSSFDVNQAQKAFDKMVSKEKNIKLVLSATSIEAVLDETNSKKLEAISYYNKKGNKEVVKAKKFIDATIDADFAYSSKAEFTLGQEDFTGTEDFMSITPVFELTNVDWDSLRSYLKNDNNPGTNADKFSAWGLSKEMKGYKSLNESIKMRGLNIGRQDNGNVLINALLIRGINPLNDEELKKARTWSEDEITKVVSYIKENIAGFEKAEYVGMADEFYVRESRHLKGEYRLTIDDVLENRDFEDRIAFGSYSVDLQGSKTNMGTVLGKPKQYAIPFRSIVPEGYENLLVVGRSASFDSLPHGSARVVPIGMVVGQAAGIASAYSNRYSVNFQEVAGDEKTHINKIQKILNREGVELQPIPKFDNPIMEHWSYPGVKLLRENGIASGGYTNEYNLDEVFTKRQFHGYLNQLTRYNETKGITIPFEYSAEPLTKNDILSFLEKNKLPIEIFTKETAEYMNEEKELKRGTAYMILSEIYHSITLEY